MNRRPEPPPADLAGLNQRNPTPHEFARQVFEWLCDDTQRAALYQQIRTTYGGVLELQSLASHDEQSAVPAAGAEVSRKVYLVASETLVSEAFTDGTRFTNAPYAGIGGGRFLLALDPSGDDKAMHEAQKDALQDAFRALNAHLHGIARWAATATQTTLLGRDEFDLAHYAEHAALRFGQVLFGFATSDLPLLGEAMTHAYRGMNLQMFARHFVVEPGGVTVGKAALARLAARAGQLMQDYAVQDKDWRPKGLERAGDGLPQFTSVLETLARDKASPPGMPAQDGLVLDGTRRATLVVGALAGMVGNIQAGVCITLQHLLGAPGLLDAARNAAFSARGEPAQRGLLGPLWESHIAPALRANPPAPFLPRRTRQKIGSIPDGADCILCVGSAIAAVSDPARGNALMFGLDQGQSTGLHWCLGATLARCMIECVVGDVLRLPGLAEPLDTRDGQPKGLVKRWGYACETYPMRYRRDQRLAQQPLNVMMRVRQPAAVHAPALRSIIRNGAPRIERVLREARHVHVAWFEFLEHDHVLVLHTVFDGDFAAYLQHFALKVDDLFDSLFEHLEGGPPLPVADHPEEFVLAILAHHRPAAEGFFFSAYPQVTTPMIERTLGTQP